MMSKVKQPKGFWKKELVCPCEICGNTTIMELYYQDTKDLYYHAKCFDKLAIAHAWVHFFYRIRMAINRKIEISRSEEK